MGKDGLQGTLYHMANLTYEHCESCHEVDHDVKFINRLASLYEKPLTSNKSYLLR